LEHNKIVQLCAGPGQGKSVALKAVANYYAQRNVFESIIFIDLKPVMTNRQLLNRLFDKLVLKFNSPSILVQEKLKNVTARAVSTEEIVKTIKKIMMSLGKKVLLLFDNIDNLLGNNLDEICFFKQIEDLIEVVPAVKVLCSASNKKESYSDNFSIMTL